jgi:pimeloyl-ACP methyl ester carboxylesterase
MNRDAHAVFKWAVGKYSRNGEIYIWGHSLGSAISVRLVQELVQDDLYTQVPLPAGLILESAPSSIADVVLGKLPDALHGYASRFLQSQLFHRFPTKERIGTLSSSHRRRRVPLLIVHGALDTDVPSAHGRLLADASGAQFVEFPSADHTNVVDQANFVEVVKAFIAPVNSTSK